MAEFQLKPRSIFDAIGGCRVEGEGILFDEAPPRTLISLAARRGGASALSKAVSDALGVTLPGPGRAATAKGITAFFAGPDQWFLSSGQNDLLDRAGRAAAGSGYVTDQSDAFTALDLSGPGTPDLLARLSSLDYADTAFPAGSAARTVMQQIPVTILRLGEGPEYRLETARSTARGFAHDVGVAVRALAARRRVI